MAINTLKKPEPRKREKARKKRREQKVKDVVRLDVFRRDPECRAARVSECGGPWTWAHLASHRRSRTRGQAPEDRHSTIGSIGLCQTHHEAYDHGFGDGKLKIEELTDHGGDGPLKFEQHGKVYIETE